MSRLTPHRRPLQRGFRASPAIWAVIAIGAALVIGARIAALAQRAPRRATSSLETLVWDFGATPAGPMRAVVMLPHARQPAERFPLLVALHGRGEAGRGVARGAWGWAQDYELGATDAALRRPRLSRDAFLGFVHTERFIALRDELRRQRYRGLVVVAPYTPDVLDAPGSLGGPLHQAFDAWVVDALVARARRELPVLTTREATGIDGVSLGGLHALWTGLGHPETFGVVGALQAAVRDRQGPVADRYVPSPSRPAQRLRLVTSDADPLRPDNLQLADVLRARGVAPEVRVVAGPHDYVFNRGAGAIEMLLFHDRAERGEPCP